MKGVVTSAEETVKAPSGQAHAMQSQSLRDSVTEALRQYFIQLDGQTPADLYNMVLTQVEHPLLVMVLQYTGGNQSKAAKIMGISRGTLRKKMAIYDLFSKE